MWKSEEGSTARLIQLCIGYFVFYVITGITVKYFTEFPARDTAPMNSMEYLVYNTIGGNLIALGVVFALRWYKFPADRLVTIGGMKIPYEFLYIIPSGLCTAVVIPTTTLMYMLPISVMVAMVIMRGSVIVISRVVDAVQIKQGILKKHVYWEENIAVVFAIMAVAVNLVSLKPGSFDFVNSPAAVGILTCYLLAYSFRIYIMNYYKNTAGKNVKQDNKSFFAIEQISASIFMILIAIFVYYILGHNTHVVEIAAFKSAIENPKPLWYWATVSGLAFGMVAFFSVFIFMFKGRTATFAGLVNRLTSLVAGTFATLVFAFSFGGKYPTQEDWITLGFILIAVYFLTRAEKKRTKELRV
jgi:hypothetical protein